MTGKNKGASIAKERNTMHEGKNVKDENNG